MLIIQQVCKSIDCLSIFVYNNQPLFHIIRYCFYRFIETAQGVPLSNKLLEHFHGHRTFFMMKIKIY